jgi:branched-chain amino acid transport system ATP-binding protein
VTATTTSADESLGLQLDGIGAAFGGLVALDGVALSVRPGQVVGVIGPNGAGKTTLFNVICGFVRPTGGLIRWNGAPLRAKPHQLAGLGIGRTLQGVGLFGGLTVVENVLAGATVRARAGFAAGLFGMPRSDRDERRLRADAMALLDRFGVGGFAAALPGTLPFAMQKRVALARALIAEPRLLLLDEPAAGLAHDEIDDFAELIRGLPADGCSVMLVEHHMDLVMAVCDQIVVLDFGKVIARGTPAEIKASGAVTAAYLGAPGNNHGTDDASEVTA